MVTGTPYGTRYDLREEVEGSVDKLLQLGEGSPEYNGPVIGLINLTQTLYQ